MKLLRLASLARAVALTILVSVTAAGQKPQIHFGKPVTYDSGGPWADGVAVADLNGDGKLDLVVTNYCQSWNQYGCNGEGEVSVLLGNGDGTFQPAVIYSTAAYNAGSVVIGDVNGDGIPDVVVANACETPGQFHCVGETGAVSVLLGNGDGTFQPAVVYSSGGNYAFSVAIGDLTGSGVPDIAVANGALDDDGNPSVAVLLGNGDGTFQPAVAYSTGGEQTNSVAIGDVNGDGIPDLIVADFRQSQSAEGEVAVLLGIGDGTFQPAVTYDSGGDGSYSVALGDLRGNGILDAVVANSGPAGAVDVLLGNGDGTFQSAVTYLAHGSTPGGASGSLAIGDLNGDGIPDVAVVELCPRFRDEVCVGTGQANVMLGNGDGTFQKTVAYSSGGYYGSATAIADVNGDGRPDLVVTSEFLNQDNYNQGTLAVLLNKTSYSTKTALTSSPNPSQVNQTVTFTATVTPTPPNGEIVTFYNGKANLGTGATTNGVATLTTSFAKAKTYTIKADYPGDAFRKSSHGTISQVVNP
jgi:Bacterial Ig-like domain (group 3)/FG-GAP-like repeat